MAKSLFILFISLVLANVSFGASTSLITSGSIDDCIAFVSVQLATNDLSHWTKGTNHTKDTNIEGSIWKLSSDNAYPSQCIELAGPYASGSFGRDVWIEQTVDVSTVKGQDIRIAIHGATSSMNDVGEHAWVMIGCDGQMDAKFGFHEGVMEESKFVTCSIIENSNCNILTVRIGGELGGYGDRLYIKSVFIQYGIPTTCGDRVTGTYHGFPVTFVVDLPFEGDLEFNAASSSFEVTDIEAFTNLNVPLGTDTDHNELVTLYAMPSGYYKFMIMGHGASSGLFDVLITCSSPDPTAFPTVNPTLIPTALPTRRPTTPSPTQPGALECGQSALGTYSGSPVLFTIAIPYDGDLIFDATLSTFPITHIEVYTRLGALVDSHDAEDAMLTVTVNAGEYTFAMDGTFQTMAIFHVIIHCVSEAPTVAPTTIPTIDVATGSTQGNNWQVSVYLLVSIVSCICLSIIGCVFVHKKRKTKLHNEQVVVEAAQSQMVPNAPHPSLNVQAIEPPHSSSEDSEGNGHQRVHKGQEGIGNHEVRLSTDYYANYNTNAVPVPRVGRNTNMGFCKDLESEDSGSDRNTDGNCHSLDYFDPKDIYSRKGRGRGMKRGRARGRGRGRGRGVYTGRGRGRGRSGTENNNANANYNEQVVMQAAMVQSLPPDILPPAQMVLVTPHDASFENN
eukprot:1024258_1